MSAVRLGFYTGRIYNDSFDETPEECCVLLNLDKPILEDELNNLRLKYSMRCLRCSGLEECEKRFDGEIDVDYGEPSNEPNFEYDSDWRDY